MSPLRHADFGSYQLASPAASLTCVLSWAEEWADAHLEYRIMKEMVYTLAAWRVQEGRQQAFISAWKDLGEAFHALSDPPGKGVLIQSTSDPTLFYSFV
ncbi:MAG TPA: hypothetical protein VIY29_04140, partial [Ktedonobacteraceae bacterium]